MSFQRSLSLLWETRTAEHGIRVDGLGLSQAPGVQTQKGGTEKSHGSPDVPRRTLQSFLPSLLLILSDTPGTPAPSSELHSQPAGISTIPSFLSHADPLFSVDEWMPWTAHEWAKIFFHPQSQTHFGFKLTLFCKRCFVNLSQVQILPLVGTVLCLHLILAYGNHSSREVQICFFLWGTDWKMANIKF